MSLKWTDIPTRYHHIRVRLIAYFTLNAFWISKKKCRIIKIFILWHSVFFLRYFIPLTYFYSLALYRRYTAKDKALLYRCPVVPNIHWFSKNFIPVSKILTLGIVYLKLGMVPQSSQNKMVYRFYVFLYGIDVSCYTSDGYGG